MIVYFKDVHSRNSRNSDPGFHKMKQNLTIVYKIRKVFTNEKICSNLFFYAPGGPVPGFGPPIPGFGLPVPGFGAPVPGFGPPVPGFGPPVPGFGPPAPCLQVTASVQINTELYSSFYRLHCWPLCFIFEISTISCLFKLVASVLSDYEWHGAWWMFLELYIVYSTPPRSVSLCEAAAPLQNHVSGPTTKMPRLPEWQIPYIKRNLNKYKFKSSKTCFWSDFETKTKSQKTSPPPPAQLGDKTHLNCLCRRSWRLIQV